MLSTLAVTGPIYLVIALGFLSVRSGVFSGADMRVLGTFVARFALPALVFTALASRDIGELVNARYLVAYGIGSLAMMALGFAWSRRVGRQGVASSGLRALGMSTSNSGFVGYPIAAQVVGQGTAAACLAMSMIVENLVMIPLALLVADAAQSGAGSWRGALRESLRQWVRNPVILAIAAGFGMSLLGWHLPAVAGKTVGMIASSSSALSLFVVGGTLVGLQVRGMRGDVVVVAGAKLLLHPLVIGVLAWWLLPAADVPMVTAAVVLAAAPMISIYPIVAQKYGFQAFCAAVLLFATLVSFATISAILALLARLAGPVA